MPEIIDLGSVHDRNAIDLATKRGTRIPNARRHERAAEALAAGKQYVLENHSTARLRSLTATYNCIGMVFANRRTWVEPTHVQMILNDDGYEEVEPRDVVPGDIVIYRDDAGEISHVAVVVAHEADVKNAEWRTTVLSQWGADGEYIHDHRDVNGILGTPDKFYSERRP
jgi:hypothetical protein